MTYQKHTSVWAEEAKLIINTVVDTYKEFDKILSSENATNSVAFLNNVLEDQEKALFLAEKRTKTLFKKQEKMYDLDGVAIDITSQIASIESDIYLQIQKY